MRQVRGRCRASYTISVQSDRSYRALLKLPYVARLLLGILATHPFTAFVTGDASLRRRPMRRVIDPLSRFGAQFLAREGGRLPLAVTGAASPVPQIYRLPVPSAQVKSAVLLAGLNTPGETTVIEPQWIVIDDPRPVADGTTHVTVKVFAALAGANLAAATSWQSFRHSLNKFDAG